MVAHKAYIVGGGQPSLEDVLRVVAGHQIQVDAAAAHRIKKESPPPKTFEQEAPPINGDVEITERLDYAQTRAALFYKLQTLINGKSKCRVDIVQTLEAMLNAQVYPSLPLGATDGVALHALANAFHGVGTATAGGNVLPILEALKTAGIETVPGLSVEERSVLEDGQAVSAGTGAICTQSGKALVNIATAVAALTAEALQADVKAFDVDITDSLPHKGALDIADTLRAMLAESRQVNAKKIGAGVLPSLITVPLVHGAALHDITVATGPVKAILSSAALPAGKNGEKLQVASPALATAMIAVATSLLRCAALSLKRTAALIERLPSVVPEGAADGAASVGALETGLRGVANASMLSFEAVQEQVARVTVTGAVLDDLPPSLAAADAAYCALRVLQQTVQSETLAAVVSLRTQEGVPAAAAAAAELPSAEAAANGGGKAAKKKKEKKGKGEATGMALGRGTSLLRKTLEATAAAAVVASAVSMPTSVSSDALAAQLLSLSLDDPEAAAQQLRFASIAINSQLDPAGPALVQLMAALTSVLEANAIQRKPKIAKGARDFYPDQMAIREVAFNKITSVFKRHGAVSIDTPVFELRETLTGKYGEDSKLIYDLADQGGELLSLRYDLTVPFARYVALNNIANIKRYHIAKVYRRDQPQMNRGRFREFFQCDFDIAGAYSTMVPDAEVLKVLVEILDDLSLGEYEVKLNHRKLLDAMLDIAGVPPQKFRPICSAIDKLDKEPWEVVRAEMTEEKGLPADVADRIGEFVVLRGKPMDLLNKLTDEAERHPLAIHPESAAALAELKILFEFLEGMGALGPIVFDLSLARGLDYYTGVIYEAVLIGGNVGSIAAGGRYDKLVGMFSGKEVPAVGVSIGIERVFAIMEAQMRAEAAAANGTIRETETQVLVASIGNGLQKQRMNLASKLWAAGVKAEFGFKPNPKMADQLGYALKAGIPYMALFGEDEITQGVVKLKDLDAGIEEVVAESELAAVALARVATKGDRRVVFASAKEVEDGEAK